MRLILGLIKGGLIGAALGYGAFRLGLGAGATGYLVYGAIGFAVGLLCGRPFWRQDTIWTSVVKGVFGLLVSMGLFWVAHRFLGGLRVPLPASLGVPEDRPLVGVPFVLGPAIGILYGIFVEVDDGGSSAAPAGGSPSKAPNSRKTS